MQWIQLGSIVPRCMEFTAINQNPLHHTAWNPLHSIEIHWATLHGIHCIQSRSIGAHCMESTAFNRDPFNPAAWNTLHQSGCILSCCLESTAVNDNAWNPLHPSGCILPCCMESTAFTRDQFSHAACNALRLIGMHYTMLHGIHCIQ